MQSLKAPATARCSCSASSTAVRSVAAVSRNVRSRAPFCGGASPAVFQQQRSWESRAIEQRYAVLAQAKKGGASSASADVDLEKVAADAEKDADKRMKKCIQVVADNFNTMRTGRANPAILDRITVEYYGAPTPLKQLASIAVPDASTLLISPFDKTAIKDIEKAINESDIGINPNNDGEKIRLNIPPMTQDRRKELTKKASKAAEEGKVAVRNVRKDVLKKLGGYDFAEDRKKGLEASIQKLTDAAVKQLDELLKSKSEDIMKI